MQFLFKIKSTTLNKMMYLKVLHLTNQCQLQTLKLELGKILKKEILQQHHPKLFVLLHPKFLEIILFNLSLMVITYNKFITQKHFQNIKRLKEKEQLLVYLAWLARML
jgi:hypothetical protein